MVGVAGWGVGGDKGREVVTVDYERAMTTSIYVALGIIAATVTLIAFAQHDDPLVALLTIISVCMILTTVFTIAQWRQSRRVERKLDAVLSLIYEEDGTVRYELAAIFQSAKKALRSGQGVGF